MFLQLSWKVRKSVFSPIPLTEGLRPRPSWHASSAQQKKARQFWLTFWLLMTVGKESYPGLRHLPIRSWTNVFPCQRLGCNNLQLLVHNLQNIPTSLWRGTKWSGGLISSWNQKKCLAVDIACRPFILHTDCKTKIEDVQLIVYFLFFFFDLVLQLLEVIWWPPLVFILLGLRWLKDAPPGTYLSSIEDFFVLIDIRV